MVLTLTHPTTPNVIVLKTNSLGGINYHENPIQAAKTIRPGMLIERIAGGFVQPHSTAAGPAEKLVATELGLVADIPGNAGDTVTVLGGGIDDNYVAGGQNALVRSHLCESGDEMYLLLPPSAAAVTEADYLTSNGDGYVKKGATTDSRLFKALESADNHLNSGSALRIRARTI